MYKLRYCSMLLLVCAAFGQPAPFVCTTSATQVMIRGEG